MYEDELEQYKDLWTYNRDKYVLVEYVNRHTKQLEYMIYDITTNTGLIIEVMELEAYLIVIERMKQAGFKVLDKIPEEK